MRCLSANPHTASKDYWKTKTQLQAAIKGIHPIYFLFAGHLSMSKPELGTEHRYSSPHSGCLHSECVTPVSTARRAKISLQQAGFWEQIYNLHLQVLLLVILPLKQAEGTDLRDLSAAFYNLILKLHSLWNIQHVQNKNLPQFRSQVLNEYTTPKDMCLKMQNARCTDLPEIAFLATALDASG